MLSANAMPAPVVRRESSLSSPSGTVNPAHLRNQPQSEPRPTIVIKPRASIPPAPTHPPLVIKLPAAATGATSAKKVSPVAAPSKERPVLTVKVPPKRRPSQQTRMPPSKQPPLANDFPLLLARWAETEKAISALSDKPHFNEKGEYLFHYPLSPAPSASRKTIPASPSVSSPSPLSSNSAHVPSSQQASLPTRLAQISLKSPSPVSGQPLPSPSVARSSFPKSPATPTDMQTPASATRPRLTLRLPGRSSLSKQSPISQPQPSASRASQPVPSPATRPCRTLSCTAVLPPSHPWIFCTDCLQSPALKTISPIDDPRTMPPISHSRRISEPSVSLVELGPKCNGPPRRKSEPLMTLLEHTDTTHIQLPQLLKSSEDASKTKASEEKTKKPDLDARCALPTPPPSSRQSTPTAPPESSDPPSSPEMPLAAASSPQAPHYRAKTEQEENLWDSDLSELTPLESDDNEDSSDDDQETTETARGRPPIAANGQQSFVCVRTKCHNLLIPWTKWKMCHACRLKLRERSRERNTVKFARASTGAAADTSGVQRQCAIKTCKTALPDVSLYRWKLCEPCRTRTRRQSRKRKYGDLGLASDEDGEEPLSAGRRRSSTVNFKKLKLTFKGETVASVEARKKEPPSMLVPDNAVRYPQYPSSQILLESLRDRLLGFTNATTQYMLFKVATNTPLDTVKPTVFAFEGEFSVIADPAGGEVGTKIQVVQGEIGKVLGIPFVLSGYRVEPNGTIVGQYTCMHDILVPLPTSLSEVAPTESATDSSLSAAPQEDPLDALLNIPDDDATNTKEPSAEKSSEKPTAVVDASKPGTPTEVKLAPTPVAEPVVKTEPETISESDALKDPKPPLTISFADATPTLLKSPTEDTVANFDVAVKRMVGELKVSILWDRSHKYFPGLRTIVQFKLVG